MYLPENTTGVAKQPSLVPERFAVERVVPTVRLGGCWLMMADNTHNSERLICPHKLRAHAHLVVAGVVVAPNSSRKAVAGLTGQLTRNSYAQPSCARISRKIKCAPQSQQAFND